MMKRKITYLILGSCLMGLLLWILSCATNPVTGKQELMLLSEADEIKLGQERTSRSSGNMASMKIRD